MAIVDAYNDPDALSNLSTYRAEFGLPPVCTGTTTSGCIRFTQESQTGRGRLPSSDVGWSEEISVDLDMVSAICPHCNILLVEANSAHLLPTWVRPSSRRRRLAPCLSGTATAAESRVLRPACDSYYAPHRALPSPPPPGTWLRRGVPGRLSRRHRRRRDDPLAREPTPRAAGPGPKRPGPTPAVAVRAYEPSPAGRAELDGHAHGVHSSAPSPTSRRWPTPIPGWPFMTATGSSGWTVFGGTSVATQIISAIYGGGGWAPTTTAERRPALLPRLQAPRRGTSTTSPRLVTGACGTDLCTAGPVGTGRPGWAPLTGRGAF